jgi:hypothetical protein
MGVKEAWVISQTDIPLWGGGISPFTKPKSGKPAGGQTPSSFLRNEMAHFTSPFTDGYVHVNCSSLTPPPQLKKGMLVSSQGRGNQNNANPKRIPMHANSAPLKSEGFATGGFSRLRPTEFGCRPHTALKFRESRFNYAVSLGDMLVVVYSEQA